MNGFRYLFCLILTFFLLSFSKNSLAQGFPWATQLNGVDAGSANSRTTDLATDAAGNIYLAGTFNGTVRFGNTDITAFGPFPGVSLPDGFIAKFNAAGVFEWIETLPSSIGATVDAIELDAAGNIYLLASFLGGVSLGGTAYGTIDDETGVLVAKLNPQREVQWVHSFISETNFEPVTANTLELGPNGDLFISGTFEGDMSLGGFALDAGSIVRWFLGRLRQDGTFLWLKPAGNLLERHSDLAVDAASNVWLTGTVVDVADFDGMSINTNGAFTFALVKYDSTGAVQWVRSAPGQPITSGGAHNIAVVDPVAGALYVAGGFDSDTFTLGNIQLTAASFCCTDMFVAKYDLDGTLLWARQSHGPAPEVRAHDIALAPGGGIFIGGTYGSPNDSGNPPEELILGEGANSVLLNNHGFFDVFLARYAANGDLKWAANASGSEADYLTAIHPVGADALVFTGQFNDTLQIGNHTLLATPQTFTDNMYLAKYDATVVATHQAGGVLPEFSVWPNPSSGNIRLQWKNPAGPARLRLLDAGGRVLQTFELNGEDQLLLSREGLANGIYYLQLESAGGVAVARFMLAN
ncbi:MAG: T9SS type A sorting domain-containing protein [Lewinellaceae bacterium]|nr:T9SS type A sorting domain-containing protein [Lewinellaceae bacterium]